MVTILKELIAQANGEWKVLDDCGGNPVIYAVFEPSANGNPNKNHLVLQPLRCTAS
ncbi:hypothetical protein [Brevibacillus sp. NRS-1366]|uniref:hypothetical protein n=1 Tax=Brevibacillus sp. NRS-1366 TaxID=3233899 RepID=UPI003D1AF73E